HRDDHLGQRRAFVALIALRQTRALYALEEAGALRARGAYRRMLDRLCPGISASGRRSVSVTESKPVDDQLGGSIQRFAQHPFGGLALTVGDPARAGDSAGVGPERRRDLGGVEII